MDALIRDSEEGIYGWRFRDAGANAVERGRWWRWVAALALLVGLLAG